MAFGSLPAGHALKHCPANQKGTLLFASHDVQLLALSPLQVLQLASQLAHVPVDVTYSLAPHPSTHVVPLRIGRAHG